MGVSLYVAATTETLPNDDLATLKNAFPDWTTVTSYTTFVTRAHT